MNKEILKEGDGEQCSPGHVATVHYTGTLEDGREFDSSRKRDKAFSFPVGQNRVIPCWDQLIAKMKVGEHAKLTCPADSAYGNRSIGGIIPANATLNFDVELLHTREYP